MSDTPNSIVLTWDENGNLVNHTAEGFWLSVPDRVLVTLIAEAASMLARGCLAWQRKHGDSDASG